MIIRKLFKFENAHIVRGSLSPKCALSLHGHSYRVEFLLRSDRLNQAQMVIDFTRVKELLGWFVEAFDHSVTIWSGDDPEYVEAMKKHSERWIVMPVSPSAEQFARVFFWFGYRALKGEGITLDSAIVHETDAAYAQAFLEDIENKSMGELKAEDFSYSEAIKLDFNGFDNCG
ncbi:MAG: 6-carboxytetrahydropterin synthase [Helicobacteraceae bacterium]|jgi:6-pyruvoyltetrahydropterin/6-carboxytetrahydropterin synthase|nr:6-carboxytetrahydropterin synthase [Helicobacteraceae bacterium]